MQRIVDAFRDLLFHRYPNEAVATYGVAQDGLPSNDEDPTGATDALRSALSGLDMGELSVDDRLDAQAIQRFVDHEQRHRREGWAVEKNLERIMTPAWMLHHHRARVDAKADPGPFVTRLNDVPRFLDALRQRWSSEHRFSGPALTMLADYALPEVIAFLESWPQQVPALGDAARAAADAYRRTQSFLRTDLMRAAVPGSDLPFGEYEWRLRHHLGVETSPTELMAAGRAALDDLTRQIVETCDRLSASAIPDSQAARGQILEWMAPTLEDRDAIMPWYERRLSDAGRFIREIGWFELPSDFTAPLLFSPPGAPDHGNWPAPVMNPDADGYFLVHPDPAKHPRFWAGVLSIHEGIPGHYLQSWRWRERFGGRFSPRFAGTADDVAADRHDWSAMMNIEGWAVHAEAFMQARGYLRGLDEMAVLVSHAIRAARLWLDVALHVDGLPPDDAVQLMAEHTFMPLGWARGQVARMLRVPTQATTYHLGRYAIEALKAQRQAAEGADFDEATFYRTFLDFGPARIADIAQAWPAPVSPR